MRIGITGISGSLGMALTERLRQHEDFKTPPVIVGITRDELKAEKIMAGRENVRCMVVAAGLDDVPAMRKAFDGCHTIIHAAALKRISGSVYSAGEIVKTNIVGTQNVLRMAREIGVKLVVVVSSDKAVEATNLYGSSKFCAECLAVQENSFSYPKGMHTIVVRYGNVLGSRGSVIHLWRDQIKKKLSMTVTDGRMTRFLITMDQAVDLILYAMKNGRAGDIVVPVLKAAHMVDLATAASVESGYGPDWARVSTGLRPGGEKLHESLLSQEEIGRTYAHDFDHLLIKPSHCTWKEQDNSGLALFDKPVYTSAVADKYSVSELVEILAGVPNRPPND